jgi:hypothetical protein
MQFFQMYFKLHLLPKLPDKSAWQLGKIGLEGLVDMVLNFQNRGVHNINFVTSTHYNPQIVKSTHITPPPQKKR